MKRERWRATRQEWGQITSKRPVVRRIPLPARKEAKCNPHGSR